MERERELESMRQARAIQMEAEVVMVLIKGTVLHLQKLLCILTFHFVYSMQTV